jgi:hypothetical protein
MRISSLSDALSSQLISLGNRTAHSLSLGAVPGIGMEARGKITSIADGLLIIPLHKILACRSAREMLRVGNDEAPQFQGPATAGLYQKEDKANVDVVYLKLSMR